MRFWSMALLCSLGIASALPSDGATPDSLKAPNFAARRGLALSSAVVTTGDMNKDGMADVIAAMPTPNSTTNYEINVQLSTGAGTFSQGPTVDLGPGFVPSAILAADFNNDGFLDLAVLSGQANELYVAFQTSKGFTLTGIQIFNGVSTTNMVAVDLNGDKRLDIAIPTSSGTVVVFNEGHEKFATPVYADTLNGVFVVAADVNHDGNADLLVSSACCESFAITVILSDGHGGFSEPISEPALPGANAIFAVADFNKDGNPDIAAAESSFGLEICLGNGDGTFQPPVPVFLPPGLTDAESVSAADINGDGNIDLVSIVYGGNANSMIVSLNAGNGTFDPGTTYPIAGNALRVLFGNFGGGAILDALVIPQNGGEVSSLLLNSGKGTFADGLLVATPSAPVYLVTGDFNGDGKLDVASVISTSGIQIFLNTGKQANLFTKGSLLPYYSGPLVVGDFNRDGKLDLVDFDYLAGETLLGNGDGTFTLKPPAFNLGASATEAIAADMNGDGNLDLVTDYPSVLLGNGDGTFQSPIVDSNSYCYSYTAFVGVADFNSDGKPDVLVACGDVVELDLGNGDGTLGYPLSTYINGTINGAVVADFNRDGIPDFAVAYSFYFANSTSTEIVIEIGNGDGTFRESATVQVAGGNQYSESTLAAADFNGDGEIDLAVLDNTDAFVGIITGNGDGTFGAPRYFGAATNPTCIVPGPLLNTAKGEASLLMCSSPGISIDLNVTK